MTPEPYKATAPQVAKGNCAKCQTPLEMPFPPLKIFNDAVVSTVLVPHTLGIDCPNCGCYHNLIIYPPGTSITLVIAPMEKPVVNEEKKVIPFTGHLQKVT